MKTIGLVGGMAWVSTLDYYRRINQKISKQLGAHHSAKIILNSVDYQDFKQFGYDNWSKSAEVLRAEIYKLESCPVNCILLCNNTQHKAFDSADPAILTKKPFLHIVDCVGAEIKQQGFRKVFLLGTKFTMEDDFFKEKLIHDFGIEVVVPTLEERDKIQSIAESELSQEVINLDSEVWINGLIAKSGCEAVVLACTELPMIVSREHCSMPIIDSVEVHCDAAVNFALS